MAEKMIQVAKREENEYTKIYMNRNLDTEYARKKLSMEIIPRF